MLDYLDRVSARARAPTPSRSPRRSTTSRSPARRTATSPSTRPRCWPSRWPTPTRWSGAARCSPPGRRAGSPSRSAGPAGAPRWPATPSTCCRCSRRPGRATSSTTRSPTTRGELRPMLLVLDDGAEEPVVREHRGRLQAAAAARGVRVETRDHRRAHRGGPLRVAAAQRAPTPPSTSASASSRTDRPGSESGTGSGPGCSRHARPDARQGPRPVARQRQDGAGDCSSSSATRGRCCRTHAVNDHLYDFLYAWHVPAFVFVTGYLSRSFTCEPAPAVAAGPHRRGALRHLRVRCWRCSGSTSAASSSRTCSATRTGRCGTSRRSSSGGC